MVLMFSRKAISLTILAQSEREAMASREALRCGAVMTLHF